MGDEEDVDLEEELHYAYEQNEKLKGRVSKYKTKLQESSKLIEDLKIQLEEAKKNEEEIKDQLKSKEEGCSKLESEIVSLKQDLEKLKKFEDNTKKMDKLLKTRRPTFIKSGLGRKEDQIAKATSSKPLDESWKIVENRRRKNDTDKSHPPTNVLKISHLKKPHNFIPRIGDIQWSKDTPVTTQIKNSIKVVEPGEEEMEEMSYEVSYDLLIGYANNLLASPKDTKNKRLGTYQERIAPAQPSSVKENKKKEDQGASVSIGTRITKSIQIKKEPVPKLYAKKPTLTRKRGRNLILQEESKEIELEEESNKMKLKYYQNMPDQTDIGAPLELDTEEIIPLDDIIDTTSNDIEPVKEIEQQLDIVGEQIAEEASITKPSVDMQPPPRVYKDSEAVLATPEMSTVDATEGFIVQILTHAEITKTLLETWDNDLE
ncbi:uncharacterized protein LOC131859327 [Cryptomeria japonica]|uniref:uncharacterized protein LOC131859327 n=1 Tax=Cryptomeria japonica TaxID=3369 RepID=UPI0027D9E12F|nr:uncharacterized protein LOC131859327 [Cryptomeria japonica]